ncbi:hypothetical protein [Burkholderia cenocepacia]|uniref:hypothetical protein n=1 Tax=Burkholderia cenocepacia TaxID=95486 RepID=UPI002AB5F9F7|nr:hypothetical protein [Burkholderia cenocepacia]
MPTHIRRARRTGSTSLELALATVTLRARAAQAIFIGAESAASIDAAPSIRRMIRATAPRLVAVPHKTPINQ